MGAPLVLGVLGAGAKLVGKPAWKLAEKLARRYVKLKDKKKQAKIVSKAKDKGVSKQFSEIKSGLYRKANKGKPKSTVSKNPTQPDPLAKMFEQERIKAAAKRKRLESVGGYNRARLEKKMGDPEKVPTYSKYGYDPSIFAKGGSVKKYAKGGGIRKARYK